MTSASGHLRTFVTERDGEAGPEPVTVDDAAWATLGTASGAVASVEVSRMATGRKNGLTIEVYGTARLAVLRPRAPQRAVRAGRARRAARRPAPGAGHRGVAPRTSRPGGRRATPSAGTTRSPRRPPTSSPRSPPARAPTPSFADGLAVQRVLAAIEQSAAASGARVDVPPVGQARRDALMGKRFTLFTGQWADLDPRGGRRGSRPAGATTAWRSRSPASTSTPGAGTTTTTSRGGSRSCAATASAAGRSPTTSPARPSATPRSTTGTARSCGRRSGATATPRACAPAPPRR